MSESSMTAIGTMTKSVAETSHRPMKALTRCSSPSYMFDVKIRGSASCKCRHRTIGMVAFVAVSASIVSASLALTSIAPPRSFLVAFSGSAPGKSNTALTARQRKTPRTQKQETAASSVGGSVTTLAAAAAAAASGSHSLERFDTTSTSPTFQPLSELCSLFQAKPTDLLYLYSTGTTYGERGVFLTRPVKKNDVILSIPLSSCLRDDMPASWLRDTETIRHDINAGAPTNKPATQVSSYMTDHNPSDWATRLASSLIDLQTNPSRNMDRCDQSNDKNLHRLAMAQKKWLSMLPNPSYLRSTLPIHWTEDVLSSAKCTALELAVDTAYFARAESVAHLSESLLRRGYDTGERSLKKKKKELEQQCCDALDIIQTRSCRVQRQDGIVNWGPPLRVVAPIFDFVNHGLTSHSSADEKNEQPSANAFFRLEGGDLIDNDTNAVLVVRARRDMDEDEEVLLDYGESARPTWRCLFSYGFVPKYNFSLPDEEEEFIEEEDDNVMEEENAVAEVYMDGIRYEVGPSTIPLDMVEAASAAYFLESKGIDEVDMINANQVVEDTFNFEDDGTYPNEKAGVEGTLGNMEAGVSSLLTPAVAMRLANRLLDVAFQVVLEPAAKTVNDGDNFADNNDDDGADAADAADEIDSSQEKLISSRLAASLRWSQHRVLLACAAGLRNFAH